MTRFFFITCGLLGLTLLVADYITTRTIKAVISREIVSTIRNDIILNHTNKINKVLSTKIGKNKQYLMVYIIDQNGERTAISDTYGEYRSTVNLSNPLLVGSVLVPVYFDLQGETEHAQVVFYYKLWQNTLLFSALWIIFSLLLFYIENRRIHGVKRIINLEVELKKNHAISSTTQMLAHDVRKPFSMIKALIRMTEASSNALEQRTILSESIPSINEAISTVEGLIQDVMLIDSDVIKSAELATPP